MYGCCSATPTCSPRPRADAAARRKPKAMRNDDSLRTIGLIGGMSWESTVPYYRDHQRNGPRDAWRPAFGAHRASAASIFTTSRRCSATDAGEKPAMCSRRRRARSKRPAPTSSSSARTRCTRSRAAIERRRTHPAAAHRRSDGRGRQGGAAYAPSGCSARASRWRRISIATGCVRCTASTSSCRTSADRDIVHRIIYDELCLGRSRRIVACALSPHHRAARRARRRGNRPRLHRDLDARRRRRRVRADVRHDADPRARGGATRALAACRLDDQRRNPAMNIDRIDHVVMTVTQRRRNVRVLRARARHAAGHVRRRPQSARVRPAKDQSAPGRPRIRAESRISQRPARSTSASITTTPAPQVIAHLARCNVTDHRGSGGENRRDRAASARCISAIPTSNLIEVSNYIELRGRDGDKTGFPRKAAARAAAFATESRQSRCSSTAAIAAGASAKPGTAFALNALIEASRVERAVGSARTRAHAVEQRPRADDRPLPAMPDRAVEPLRGWRDRVQLRARRHARRPRSTAARHPHLHVVEAAVGRCLPPDVPAACPSTTIANAHWPPRRASSAGACCWRRSQPTKTRRPPASLRRAG